MTKAKEPNDHLFIENFGEEIKPRVFKLPDIKYLYRGERIEKEALQRLVSKVGKSAIPLYKRWSIEITDDIDWDCPEKDPVVVSALSEIDKTIKDVLTITYFNVRSSLMNPKGLTTTVIYFLPKGDA